MWVLAINRGGVGLALGAAMAVALTGPAQAQWVTEVQTGNEGVVLATMSGTINDDADLVVQCTNTGKAALALILADNITKRNSDDGSATLTIKSDSGDAFTGSANILRNNKNFVAINWTGLSQIPDIVHDILDAQKTIEVAFTVEAGTNSGRFEISAAGSTDAARTIETVCFGKGASEDSGITPPPRN
ncbi:MAG: hypothetical protein GXP01_04355 [Alphaproteobacteria bacterium]|nr:hypothetical protein [Alphaproteobacteria bacterium]